MSERIARTYNPSPYPGSIVLVESEVHAQRKQLTGSEDLPAADIRIIRVEGCYTHLDLMQQPHISVWMEWLSHFFSE